MRLAMDRLDLAYALSLVPTRREAVLGLLVLAAGLLLAAIAERLTRPGARLLRELPDEVAVTTRRWTLRIVVVSAVLAGLEVAGLIPVRAIAGAVRAVLVHPLFTLTDTPVSVLTALTVFVALLVARRVSGVVQQGLAGALRNAEGSDAGVVASVQRLAHYAVLLFGLIFGLQVAGFDLSTLLAASAVLGVGIAFGLQNLSENFVSGLILLFERTIRPGDIITADGRLVRVVSMGIRSTSCLSQDDEEIIVPNAHLVGSLVVNHSTPDAAVRARATVGVAYESDVDVVLRVLDAAARTVPERDVTREPIVFLVAFGASSIDFEVSIWAADAFARPKTLSTLRVAVWRALKEAGVVIAFPQLDVHLEASLARALARRGEPDPT